MGAAQQLKPGHAIAYCWRTGRVDIGPYLPDGAIAIVCGPEDVVRREMAVACRHGQGASEGVLLVPGIPEAETDEAAGDALEAFLKWRKDGVMRRRQLSWAI